MILSSFAVSRASFVENRDCLWYNWLTAKKHEINIGEIGGVPFETDGDKDRKL